MVVLMREAAEAEAEGADTIPFVVVGVAAAAFGRGCCKAS
jgi:hypothetical protein